MGVYNELGGDMQSTNVLRTVEQRSRLFDRLFSHRVLLVLVILLGTALRFYQLGTESFWLDEVTMVNIANGSVASIIDAGIRGRPPLFVLASHFWMGIFGNSEIAARSLPALFNIGALIMLYVVGRRLLGRNVALVATFIMAISERQIYHSQDVRYYSMWIFTALVSMYFFSKALETSKWRYWWLFSLATIGVFYTHSFGIFFLIAQNLYLLLRWRRYRHLFWRWAAAHIPIALSLSPALIKASGPVANGTSGVMTWIPDRPIWYPLRTVYLYVFPAREFPGVGAIAIALAVVAVVLLLWIRRQTVTRWLRSVRQLAPSFMRLGRVRREGLLLTACWFICPIAIPFLLSKLLGPLYIDRYTITAAPAFYLLLALALMTMRKVIPLTATLGSLVVLITPGLYDYYALDVKQQFREVAQYIQQHEQPGDLIVYAPGESGTIADTVNYYYRGQLPNCDLDVNLQGAQIEQTLNRCVTENNSQRLWVMLRGEDSYVGHLRRYFLDQPHQQLRLIQTQDFGEFLTLHEFEVTR